MAIIFDIITCSLFTLEQKHFDHHFPCFVQTVERTLSLSKKTTDSLSSFKSKLKTKKHKNFYHDIGCRKISCILASIRMKCSKLKHDVSMNNTIDNNMCQCGNTETAYHLFFECPLYTIYRNDLQIETMILHSLTLNIILNGDITLPAQSNIEIHTAVSKYIMKTNRF